MTVPRKRLSPKKTAAARKATTPPDPLSPGDMIEFSMTAEIKGRKGAFWVKAGTTTTIRPDEHSDKAKERATGFVEDLLAEAVEGLG